MTKETTDANFKNDVIESEIPVIVDFWAPGAGMQDGKSDYGQNK